MLRWNNIKPTSRDQAYKNRMMDAGRCKTCGQPRREGSAEYCEKHWRMNRAAERKRRGVKTPEWLRLERLKWRFETFLKYYETMNMTDAAIAAKTTPLSVLRHQKTDPEFKRRIVATRKRREARELKERQRAKLEKFVELCETMTIRPAGKMAGLSPRTIRAYRKADPELDARVRAACQKRRDRR